jgi:hypothetical protein
MLKLPSPYSSALALVGLLAASFVQAQDLAAMARKEKARRAKVTKPVKVLTEEDGKEASNKGVGSVTALAEGAGGASSVPTEPVTASAPDASQKASWKERADAARQAVVTAEKDLAQMERDLAVYRSDMTPVSAADAQDPMRLQNREARIHSLIQQIEAQKVALADTKKALVAFEDEARRSGIPAGWLR